MRRLIATLATGLLRVHVFAAQAFAQPSPPASELTLGDVVRSAERQFPLVIAALRERDAAEAETLAAEGGFDPIVKGSANVVPEGGYTYQRYDAYVEQPTPFWGTSLIGGYRLGTGKFPVYYGQYVTNDHGEARAGVKIPLLRDGPIDRRRASIRRAELGVDIAKMGAEQQRLETVRVGSQRYWDWVAAGRRLEIVRDWLNLARTRDEGLAVRVERGDLSAVERQENRRTILQREAQLIVAERALAEAANELSLFLRRPDNTTMVPSADRLPRAMPLPVLVPTTPESAENDALRRRPELRKLDATVRQGEVELKWSENQRLPAVDALLMYSKDFGPGDPLLAKPVFEALVTVDVHTLARSARGRIRANEAALARTRQQVIYTRDRIRADVRNALVSVEAARLRADVATKEYDVARSLASAELERFGLGDASLLIVNLREQASAEAAVRHVDALADYHKAVATYRAVIAA